jgi:hypothetical protein
MQLNIPKAACCPYKTLVTGFVVTLLGAAVVAMGVGYLGSDLWALVAAEEAMVAVSDQALPVDAPSVSLVRCKAQETETNLANSGAKDEVVLLNNWSYTQSNVTFSPFIFGAPNGFDFFNPLFALDFVPSQQGFGNPFALGLSPFGFGTTNTFGGFTVPTSSGTIVVGNGTATSTTTGTSASPVAFLNGAQIFISITATTFVFPLPIGTEAFSHRHAFTPVIVIVNIIVINTTPVSPST